MPQEKFDLYFLAMGQGDCTLIKCPDDKVVMIDCGSDRGFSDNLVISARAILRTLIGTTNQVDTLILTHHDGDHCNELGTVLFNNKVPHIQISQIFYSNPYSFKGKTLRGLCLQRYAIKDFVLEKKFGSPLINEVVINSGNSLKNSWSQAYGYGKKDSVQQPITNKKLTVYSGTSAVGNKNWSISIIAAGVPHESGSPSNAINSGSIVTLLEFDGHKALICGDATVDTEQFLLNTHATAIENVKFVQVPHHGSESSSKQAFVNKTAPVAAVISSQFLEHHHRLPRKEIMNRWLNKVTGRVANHALDSWRADQTDYDTLFEQMKQIILSEQHLPLDQRTIGGDGNFIFYLDGLIGDFAYNFPNWMLNRLTSDHQLWQTATLGQTDQAYIKLSLPL